MQPHVQTFFKDYLVHLADTLKIFLKFVLRLILHLFCTILESNALPVTEDHKGLPTSCQNSS